MRVRNSGYKEYGITKEEANALIKLCQTADETTERLLLEAARESCPECADDLVYGLKSNLSYEKLCGRSYIYLGKNDFYGYRRKTLFLFKEKLMAGEKTIIEKWKNDGCLRRYASLEDVSNELLLSKNSVVELAKKANALYRFGPLLRIDMNALYGYIDRECAVTKRI